MRLRPLVACIATVAILAPLAWFWRASLLPSSYSVMPVGHAGHEGHGRSVTMLTADLARPADVSVTLVARKERLRLASGRTMSGYTLNGQSPGPVIHADVGQLVQVRLVNESVPDGVTLHWHGVDVPNAVDGVAGVTQDAVLAGHEFVYRFVPDRAGTFWYHSHQVSHEQVASGLLGALIVGPSDNDVLALVHLYGPARTVNGFEGSQNVTARPGTRVRVRIINTDNGPMPVWVVGSPFRVVAVDGSDLHAPSMVRDVSLLVTAGARMDLEIVMPASPVRVQMGGATSIVLGSEPYDIPSAAKPPSTLDLLSYGMPAPLGFDPAKANKHFTYDIGRRPGFLDGTPGLWWTVNGRMFPDVPMFTVALGDIVRMTVSNNSGDVHPMHLHGHRAVVLARDGVAATGSPWWVDSLNVGDGETYEIAFVANNPGIWMDHCHNLPHAGEGLVAHLMYEGISTPYTMGTQTGNNPE